VDEEFKPFQNPSELVDWLEENDILMNINKDDSETLFNYMEGHGYQLGVIGKGLAKSDFCSNECPEYDKLTIDEIIDSVCEWNYEMLQHAKEKLHEPSNFVDYMNTSNYRDALMNDEKKLDGMFNKTCFGKEVEELARRLAMEAIRRIQTGRREKKADERCQEIEEMDKVKEKSTLFEPNMKAR
jgi:hypothetical protein